MVINRLYFFLFFIIVKFGLNAQAPTATIIVPTNTFCTDAVYTFSSSVSSSITSYSWSVVPSSNVTITPNNFSSTADIKFSNNVIHTVVLFVANGSGTFQTTRAIALTKAAKASYNATLIKTEFPVSLKLTNYSSDYIGVNWNFGAAAPTQTVDNLVQTFTTSGSYSVSLIAFGNNGCNDTLDYSFVVDEFSDVKLPNIFTPNGDNANDEFKPICKGISELKVYVYDRWGVLMHSWDTVNGSWDGYTTSGIKCPAGVYFYVLEAKGVDGKEYKLKSNLTLIR